MCAAKLIENLEAAGKPSRETKVTKETGEETLTKARTKPPPENKSPNLAGPEEPIEPRMPVEENMAQTEENMAQTETKPKSMILDTAKIEEIWARAA